MALMLLCLLLPLPHLTTLRYIMCFLSRVAKNAASNKLDTPNLAVCMAPNILHNSTKAEKMNSESKLLHVSRDPDFRCSVTPRRSLSLGVYKPLHCVSGSNEHRAPVDMSRAGDRFLSLCANLYTVSGSNEHRAPIDLSRVGDCFLSVCTNLYTVCFRPRQTLCTC